MNFLSRLVSARRRLFLICLLATVVGYGISYLVLTRQAFARSDARNIHGFYFYDISRREDLWIHQVLRVVYWPLIEVDCLLGTGRPAGSDPTYDLS